ncbi:endocuticle structural glycoprotein SgAbd-2-like [Diabrotica virgifera virgifera]|uniref:Endocuticle structural glycoprotein SgAbd-2-like n=1 Tax=Diabrotica virgifera virgifera TaxID=50390 RepID=A0A6P7F1Z5_DIAVI|nr:endocuticle structural glycoprotein SgAbd-2-like [Diabrotica virgifera virgifera]
MNNLCHEGVYKFGAKIISGHNRLRSASNKMKTIIAFLAILAVSLAASLDHLEPKHIPIIRQENEVSVDGNYRSSFETGNGIVIQEQGVQKNAGSQDAASEVHGSAEWQSPEGIPVVLKYVANEFGYQPEGNLLPTPPTDTNTPPPIPEAILRSLEWNAAHPEENEEYQRPKHQ